MTFNIRVKSEIQRDAFLMAGVLYALYIDSGPDPDTEDIVALIIDTFLSNPIHPISIEEIIEQVDLLRGRLQNQDMWEDLIDRLQER